MPALNGTVAYNMDRPDGIAYLIGQAHELPIVTLGQVNNNRIVIGNNIVVSLDGTKNGEIVQDRFRDMAFSRCGPFFTWWISKAPRLAVSTMAMSRRRAFLGEPVFGTVPVLADALACLAFEDATIMKPERSVFCSAAFSDTLPIAAAGILQRHVDHEGSTIATSGVASDFANAFNVAIFDGKKVQR